MQFKDEQLLARVRQLSTYKSIPKYFIIAVRNSADVPNTFDDKLYLYIDGDFQLVAECTTNAGTPALVDGWRAIGQKGAAIIASDTIFYDAYMKSDGVTIRHHKDKMPCLRQIRELLYYRDGDNDLKAEEIGDVYRGNFSTNIHFNSYNLFNMIKTALIGAWSFGCIVLNQNDKYRKLLDLIPLGAKVSLVVLNSNKIPA
jgi:hypothetical protein